MSTTLKVKDFYWIDDNHIKLICEDDVEIILENYYLTSIKFKGLESDGDDSVTLVGSNKVWK